MFADHLNLFAVDCSMKRWPAPSPKVAELSAPITTPSLQRMPTIAVTVVDSMLLGVAVLGAYPALNWRVG
jgi:hypothetical protein